MNLLQQLDILAGGPGSGCNPDVGVCGRPPGHSGGHGPANYGMNDFQQKGYAILQKAGFEYKGKTSKGFPAYKHPNSNSFIVMRSIQWKATSHGIDGKAIAFGPSPKSLKDWVDKQGLEKDKSSELAKFIEDIKDYKVTNKPFEEPKIEEKLKGADVLLENFTSLGIPKEAAEKIAYGQGNVIDKLAQSNYVFMKVSQAADGGIIMKNTSDPSITFKVTDSGWTKQINGTQTAQGSFSSIAAFENALMNLEKADEPKKTSQELYPKNWPSLTAIVGDWKGGNQSYIRGATLDYVNNKTNSLNPMAKVLLNAVADAPKTNYPLYRSMNLSKDKIKDWKDSYAKEESIRLAPIGFSKDYEYITSAFSGNVQMFLAPGAKALNIAPITPGYQKEQEHIAAGEYKVIHVADNPQTGKTEIYLHMLNTFEKFDK